MKRFYFILMLTFAMFAHGQTFLVNDFESGLSGAYVAWGGSCERIENPTKNDANSSDYVLKVVSEDFAPVGFSVSLPEGKTLANYTGMRFQAMILEGSENIHWIGFNVGISQDLNTMDLVDPTAGNGAAWGDGHFNKWVDVELLFNEAEVVNLLDSYTSEEYNVMIKLGRQSFIYAVDNVRLIEKEEVDNPYTIFTFESMDLGISTRVGMPWSGSCSIVENPVKSDDNPSNKCLEVQGGEFSPVTFSGALPDGHTWSDFDGVSFQMAVVNDPEEVRHWGGCELGIRLDNGPHIKIGSAYDDDGNETAAFGEVPLAEWININLSIKEDLITEEANTTGTLYLRVMKQDLTYYVDNITLSLKNISSVKELDTLLDCNVIGLSGRILIEAEKDVLLNIFSIDGVLVSSGKYSVGTHYVDLPKGVYIANKKKVLVY